MSDASPGNYETNLNRLRQVVEKLERGALSLEDSLKLFEEGMQLSQLCDSQLSAVEERVKVLVSEHQPQELATRKEIELEIINVESTRD